ncbi:MAG: hypothetical protein ACREOA_02320 [Candidatus Dormibacteria bacterium]
MHITKQHGWQDAGSNECIAQALQTGEVEYQGGNRYAFWLVGFTDLTYVVVVDTGGGMIGIITAYNSWNSTSYDCMVNPL